MIIIRNLYSAIMPLGGYRGASACLSRDITYSTHLHSYVHCCQHCCNAHVRCSALPPFGRRINKVVILLFASAWQFSVSPVVS